jgi:uncharacterized protein YjbI with pentapeptide repeats
MFRKYQLLFIPLFFIAASIVAMESSNARQNLSQSEADFEGLYSELFDRIDKKNNVSWGKLFEEKLNSVLSYNKTYLLTHKKLPPTKEGLCLYCADLSVLNLRGFDLRGAKLMHAKLNKAILDGANLESADLSNAKLHGSSLKGAKLARCKFARTNFLQADLSGASLHYCDLSRASFERAVIKGTLFLHANITDVEWERAIASKDTKFDFALMVVDGREVCRCHCDWDNVLGVSCDYGSGSDEEGDEGNL